MKNKTCLMIVIVIATLSFTVWADETVTEDIVEQVEAGKNASAEIPVEPSDSDIPLKQKPKSEEEFNESENIDYELMFERLRLIAKFFMWFLLGILVIYTIGGFVCCRNKMEDNSRDDIFEIDENVTEPVTCLTVRRYIASLLIYTFYKPMFIGAMAATFTKDSKGEGWGNHYILSLIAVMIATFCAAFLVGATAKKKGGFVASIANIPSILFSIVLLCFFYKTGTLVENVIGWNISIILGIIASIGLAYWGGKIGEKKQYQEFESNTILGIRPFHWSWLWFMGFIYLVAIFYVALRWIVIDNITDLDIISIIPVIVAVIPVVAYGYPMLVMYEILRGNKFEEKTAFIKVLAFIGIYIGGLFLGTGVDFVCSKILSFLTF